MNVRLCDADDLFEDVSEIRPPFELNAPGTFSQTMNLGFSPLVASLISFTILICWWKSVDRSPSSPLRFPATLMSWHGEPPLITSTASTFEPLIREISPSCTASGKFFFSTRIGYGSISDCHALSMPTIRAA